MRSFRQHGEAGGLSLWKAGRAEPPALPAGQYFFRGEKSDASGRSTIFSLAWTSGSHRSTEYFSPSIDAGKSGSSCCRPIYFFPSERNLKRQEKKPRCASNCSNNRSIREHRVTTNENASGRLGNDRGTLLTFRKPLNCQRKLTPTILTLPGPDVFGIRVSRTGAGVQYVKSHISKRGRPYLNCSA